ncbi:MAG: hypothetical protein Fur003_5000 [Candidatus Dojkabacteria bacterium]
MKHIEDKYCTCGGAGRCTGCNLFTCKTCGGAEADLPTDCPGTRLTSEQRAGIAEGSLDFIGNEWIKYEDHVFESCCSKCRENACPKETQACVFSRCKVCGIDDSTKFGEYQLKSKCKGAPRKAKQPN